MKTLVIAILLIFLVSGCIDNVGKEVYVSQKHNETIILYSDHAANIIGDNYSISGTYRRDGDQVIITMLPLGNLFILKDTGKRLVYEADGDFWEKV